MNRNAKKYKSKYYSSGTAFRGINVNGFGYVCETSYKEN